MSDDPFAAARRTLELFDRRSRQELARIEEWRQNEFKRHPSDVTSINNKSTQQYKQLERHRRVLRLELPPFMEYRGGAFRRQLVTNDNKHIFKDEMRALRPRPQNAS
jgi:hypothetical protein